MFFVGLRPRVESLYATPSQYPDGHIQYPCVHVTPPTRVNVNAHRLAHAKLH